MKKLMIVGRLAALCVTALVPQTSRAGVGLKGGYSLVDVRPDLRPEADSLRTFRHFAIPPAVSTSSSGSASCPSSPRSSTPGWAPRSRMRSRKAIQPRVPARLRPGARPPQVQRHPGRPHPPVPLRRRLRRLPAQGQGRHGRAAASRTRPT
ncbi:MAG: hypothetical protein M0C28_38955 [Candidatus Moduliflexus flocculans]|nr:hypothetical protein [Candidatus Moduliflexus flocculans]